VAAVYEWLSSFSAAQRVFALFAVPATLLLLVQILLIAAGMSHSGPDADHSDISGLSGGHDAGAGHEADSADFGHAHAFMAFGLKLLTIRSITAFFAIGGWVGVLAGGSVFGLAAAVPAAAAGGLAASVAVTAALSWAQSLEEAGNIDIRNAVGGAGVVYVRVPGLREGTGKVSLTVQGRLSEFDAVTDEPQGLQTGAAVAVKAVTDDGALVCVPAGDYHPNAPVYPRRSAGGSDAAATRNRRARGLPPDSKSARRNDA
jgi:hypothetical protein